MWDDQRRDGGTNCTFRIKEQEKRLTVNKHDDDDDDDCVVLMDYCLFLCSNAMFILQ